MTIRTRLQLEKKLSAFKAWLTERGAEVLEPTNEFEVVRFRAGASTNVIYSRKNGLLTLSGAGVRAMDAWINGAAWSAGVKTKRGALYKAKRSALITSLLKRDGCKCFLCLLPLGEDITVEHLVPVASGGPDHIANKALAHSACNEQMGHLSVMEKIKMREGNFQ